MKLWIGLLTVLLLLLCSILSCNTAEVESKEEGDFEAVFKIQRDPIEQEVDFLLLTICIMAMVMGVAMVGMYALGRKSPIISKHHVKIEELARNDTLTYDALMSDYCASCTSKINPESSLSIVKYTCKHTFHQCCVDEYYNKLGPLASTTKMNSDLDDDSAFCPICVTQKCYVPTSTLSPPGSNADKKRVELMWRSLYNRWIDTSSVIDVDWYPFIPTLRIRDV